MNLTNQFNFEPSRIDDGIHFTDLGGPMTIGDFIQDSYQPLETDGDNCYSYFVSTNERLRNLHYPQMPNFMNGKFGINEMRGMVTV